MERYQAHLHPAVQAAEERRDKAEEAATAARKKAEALIEQAKAKGKEAKEAARAGDDAAADQALSEQTDLKAQAERQDTIADAREEMLLEAEQTFRATIEKAKEELREEARAERGEKLMDALAAYETFSEKMEAAREIDERCAGLAGSARAKAIPPLQVNGVRGTTSTLDRYMDRIREQAESDLARTA